MPGLREFARRMKRRANQIVVNAEKGSRRVALVVHEKVVTGTPVDEGTARANWQVGIGGPVTSVIPAYATGSQGSTAGANTRAAVARGQAVIQK